MAADPKLINLRLSETATDSDHGHVECRQGQGSVAVNHAGAFVRITGDADFGLDTVPERRSNTPRNIGSPPSLIAGAVLSARCSRRRHSASGGGCGRAV